MDSNQLLLKSAAKEMRKKSSSIRVQEKIKIWQEKEGFCTFTSFLVGRSMFWSGALP
jgi:hypothetical protein